MLHPNCNKKQPNYNKKHCFQTTKEIKQRLTIPARMFYK